MELVLKIANITANVDRSFKYILKIALCFIVLLICACSNSGSNYDAEDVGCGGGINCTGKPPKPGKALLGPVINATVQVFTLEDRVNYQCEVKTESSEDLTIAGSFTLPEECIKADELYLVSVQGGIDIDADDNGIVDQIGTPVEGSFHAFVTGQQMMDEVWQVTAVSEAMFQSVQNLLDQGYSQARIREHLEAVVPQFLAEDINGDGKINTDDILQFNPQIHFKQLTRPTQNNLREAIDDIHLAENNTIKDVALDQGIIGHFDTLAAATRLTVSDDLVAYVATKTAMLAVDVSDPSTPTLLGAYPSGWIYDVVILEDFAFIAMGPLGMQLVDISDPSALKGLGRSTQSAYRLKASNGAVFYTTESDVGTSIDFGSYDISNPQQPRAIVLHSFEQDLAILTAFSMYNDLALISTSSLTESNTYVLSINRSPQNIAEIKGSELKSKITFDLATTSFVLDIAVADINGATRAYFAVGQMHFSTLEFSQTLLAYDISDSSSPQALSLVSNSVRPLALQADSDSLLVWEETQLSRVPLPLVTSGSLQEQSAEIIDLVDVSRATAEILLSIRSRTLTDTLLISLLDDTFNFDLRFVVKNGYAYVAADRYGLLVFDFPEAL